LRRTLVRSGLYFGKTVQAFKKNIQVVVANSYTASYIW